MGKQLVPECEGSAARLRRAGPVSGRPAAIRSSCRGRRCCLGPALARCLGDVIWRRPGRTRRCAAGRGRAAAAAPAASHSQGAAASHGHSRSHSHGRSHRHGHGQPQPQPATDSHRQQHPAELALRRSQQSGRPRTRAFSGWNPARWQECLKGANEWVQDSIEKQKKYGVKFKWTGHFWWSCRC